MIWHLLTLNQAAEIGDVVLIGKGPECWRQIPASADATRVSAGFL